MAMNIFNKVTLLGNVHYGCPYSSKIISLRGYKSSWLDASRSEMIDLCQWRARVGSFNASRGRCRPFATENWFVGLDPLLHCSFGAIANLAGLVLSVIGAVGTTTATTTTAEGKRAWKHFKHGSSVTWR